MPTPVAHTLAGVSILGIRAARQPARYGWRGVLAVAAAANLPDIDLAMSLLPEWGPFVAVLSHRGALHSLAGTAAFAIMVLVVARVMRLESPAKWALALGAAYGSHLLLDMLNADYRAPYGVPLLWPLSDTYFIAPYPIFLNIEWPHPERWISFHHALAVTIEFVVLGPLAYLAFQRTRLLQSFLAYVQGRR